MSTIEMIEVKSSNIEKIGYDHIESELFVKFKDDGPRIYKYKKVPSIVWDAMLKADSKGTFLKHIVIPYFEVEQIRD